MPKREIEREERGERESIHSKQPRSLRKQHLHQRCMTRPTTSALCMIGREPAHHHHHHHRVCCRKERWRLGRRPHGSLRWRARCTGASTLLAQERGIAASVVRYRHIIVLYCSVDARLELEDRLGLRLHGCRQRLRGSEQEPHACGIRELVSIIGARCTPPSSDNTDLPSGTPSHDAALDSASNLAAATAFCIVAEGDDF